MIFEVFDLLYSIDGRSRPREITIEAEDSVAASVAVFLLGRGDYAMLSEEGEIFPASCVNPEAWLAARGFHWIHNLTAYIKKNQMAIAAVLASAALGSVSDREVIISVCKASGEDLSEALAEWNRQQSTSPDDLCWVALRLAAVHRSQAEQGVWESCAEQV